MKRDKSMEVQMNDEIRQDIESLGMKTTYIFKQTHIPTSELLEDKHQKLREIVAPAIRDLESKSLINGFYHIIHQDIDLRLSCDDWEQHEPEIKKVLADHSISTELEPGGNLGPKNYGGFGGALLTENNLEINSRLTLAIIELIHSTNDKAILQGLSNQCPHQWFHHLCNQFGFNNFSESMFYFNNALIWLETIIHNNKENPQAISEVRRIINTFKDQIVQFENTHLNQ
jgi:hypothetical protein